MDNTILFVAFDFEELTKECEAKRSWQIACGSDAYVKNLTSYLAKTGGTVGGALILETTLNHNSSASMFYYIVASGEYRLLWRVSHVVEIGLATE